MYASAAVCIVLIELDCASRLEDSSPWKHEICRTCQVLITTSFLLIRVFELSCMFLCFVCKVS